MSCSCNNSYRNLPCCCPTVVPTTTHTTTLCPNGEPCEEAYSSDCVTYTGNGSSCYGIITGSNVTQVINILIAQLPQCTTTTTTLAPITTTTTTIEPTTTTTTVAPIPSNCIEFVVNTTNDTFFSFSFNTLGAINFTIDWGDGTTHPDSGGGGFYEETHTYPEADREYTVRCCFDNIDSVIAIDFPGFD